MSSSEDKQFFGKVLGIIPARWGSSRFPGKPLSLIAGVPLIQRTYEQAVRSKKLDDLIVATDDDKIYDCVISFGGKCVMTEMEHPTGSCRVAEVAEKYCLEAQIIVNIQGDEPCLEPGSIDALVEFMLDDERTDVITPVFLTSDSEKVFSMKRAKCVLDSLGNIVYFSRQSIPSLKRDNDFFYYVHCGVYCFRKTFLVSVCKKPRTDLSIVEDLEQLSFLEYGGKVRALIVNGESPAVDYPEDIEIIEKLLLY
ncbi:MAG: 3-deoxy-manno-octulosonate cytidylyltransferase [Victivallaceae bacterium]